MRYKWLDTEIDMSTVDPNKKIQKMRTEQEMRWALLILQDGYSITAQSHVSEPDVIFSDVIEELLEARKILAAERENT
jgi:predicted CopG family antitoxin